MSQEFEDIREPGPLIAALVRRFGDRAAIGTSGQLTGSALIDLALAEGQIIRSPFDCTVVKIGFEPGGSGNYICLVSDVEYDWDDGRKTM